MPSPEFPHLALVIRDKFEATFSPAFQPNAEVEANRKNRKGHVSKIRTALKDFSDWRVEEEKKRSEFGLPPIPKGAGFLLRLPDGVDADGIAHFLGTQLVAETNEGYILVATSDLTFAKIEEALVKFAANEDGGGRIADVLDVYGDPSDAERLKLIIAPSAHSLFPLLADQEYIFDISFQMAESVRAHSFPQCRKKSDETIDEFAARKRALRDLIIQRAQEKWLDQAEATFRQLCEFVRFYNGEFLTGQIHDQESIEEDVVLFPDSFQVRIQMSGTGFEDIIKNFPNLFEIERPEEIAQPSNKVPASIIKDAVNVLPPGPNAPAVCVIDTGIQENHKWLAPAIDSGASRCFLPGRDPTDVADKVPPAGHGTGVAGLILYPDGVPKDGEIESTTWIQNARVCDDSGRIPNNLRPASYLDTIVQHFLHSNKETRLYNHSISGSASCPTHRMTAWATKIDDLSHRLDVLFFQCAGNLLLHWGLPPSPGIFAHLSAGRPYPDYLLEKSCRVANPAQSLQALTIGSISGMTFENPPHRSFASDAGSPSCFSRTGYGLWDAIKPELVEIGGDAAYNIEQLSPPTLHEEVSVETLNSTINGAPAYSRDKIGTSYSTPRVAYIAAMLQRKFPKYPTLLYRGLIVQSAKWPSWGEKHEQTDTVLRHFGYGVPSFERASSNTSSRITLITPNATVIRAKELHLYAVPIPNEIRNLSDTSIRLEVTLSYSASPRRTRSSRQGYLETWLDWRSSGLDEPLDVFTARMQKANGRTYTQPAWKIHYSKQHGEAEETRRDIGTVQKDWADIPADNLPSEMGIAVRAHAGWNHRDLEGEARYCLIVSFEAMEQNVPVYSLIAAQVEVPVEQRVAI